jgi:hypothetical protein
MINQCRSTPLYTFLLATLLSCAAAAQGTMKVSADGGGGTIKYPPGWKPRLFCSANRTDGSPGPIARAAWQVASPGRVNFCVHAGMQGNYGTLPTGTGGKQGDTSSASTAVLRTAGPIQNDSKIQPLGLPITLSLKDIRASTVSEKDWVPPPTDRESAVASRPHSRKNYPERTLTEPVQTSFTVLANAWCVNDLNWGSRPYLIVEASGPGVRGHTAEDEISCIVDFGKAEPAGTNLLIKVSPPTWTSPASSSQGKVITKAKQ